MATEVVRTPQAVVPTAGARLWSSLAAGQLAGLVMAAAVMAVAVLFLGKPLLFPVQLIASLILGHDALTHASPGVILTGLLLHQLGIALGWSLVYFGLVMVLRERVDLNRALMVGFLLGIASMVVDVFMVGPALQQITSGENLWMKHLPRSWDWAAHMIFGMSLGLFYWVVQNAMERRRGLVTREHIPKTVTADDAAVRRSDGKRLD